MNPSPLLIANRGEIAIRIARTAADLGLRTVAVYGDGDGDSLHVERADEAVLVEGGSRAYLDAAALVRAAGEAGCTAVHPGYGFLAEQADFARACEDAGLVFVGPTAAQLVLCGDKLAARALAAECGVPTLEASGALADAPALEAFRATLAGAPAMVKAAAGGGGRGMRVLGADDDAAAVFAACAEEAAAAFGDGTLYAERCVERARHVEVQVAGDGRGAVTHLWERDCTLQRRHQKLVEIAPAPGLARSRRDALLDAALAIAGRLDYRGLGTFEFLCDADGEAFWFIEANARLQVEHTVTEAVLGMDLVALQLGIAGGATLAALGLGDGPPAAHGCAVQLRVNAETFDADGTALPASGTIARFDPPGGPGVRVDTAAYPGGTTNPAFDSLLAKLVVHVPDGDYARALRRAGRAADEFAVTGVATNLPLLNALVRHPVVVDAAFDTRFVEREAAALAAAATAFVRAEPAPAAAHGHAAHAAPTAPPGTLAVSAPMRASVISVDVAAGEAVRHGQQLAVLEAMKMHHVVTAPGGGTVEALLAAAHDVLDEGAPIVFMRPDAGEADEQVGEVALDLDAARADLDEVHERHALTLDAARPEAVARRRRHGSRTARENVEDLCDAGSFIEYGALAIAAQRRRRSVEDLMEKTPADGMIAGFGTVNAAHFGEDAARCAVLAYDYTVLAGTQGHHNHKKKDRLFELAAEWKTPVVFFTEGGGGRPGDVDTDDLFMSWLDIKTFATWPKLSGIAPRIAINSGRCFAGNAVIFGCADLTIATRNSNIGLAGPAMIEGGGLGRYTPEDIGPVDVQAANGVIDVVCEDEAEATAVARAMLGCFQGRVDGWSAADQRVLRHLVPENRLRVYDMRAVVHALADEGSVIELRRDYGVGLITALLRIEGEPFGLIANDPRHLGGAIDGDGGEKGGRFLGLCDTYGLPVISLCDTPGYMVGPDSEKTAAVRRGSRLILASANLSVPLFTVVVRKGYGLGAQAMAGGSFHQPFFTIAWPTAEMGPMGLEGAVELGFSKELAACETEEARRALYEELLGHMYAKGKAVSVAQTFEIDAVIDPAETRAWLLRGLRAAGAPGSPRRYVDVW